MKSNNLFFFFVVVVVTIMFLQRFILKVLYSFRINGDAAESLAMLNATNANWKTTGRVWRADLISPTLDPVLVLCQSPTEKVDFTLFRFRRRLGTFENVSCS